MKLQWNKWNLIKNFWINFQEKNIFTRGFRNIFKDSVNEFTLKWIEI